MYHFTTQPLASETDCELRLDADNRWVRQAHILPWKDLRLNFPDLLTEFSAQYDDPFRLALTCRLIQTHYRVSQTEVLAMIQENPYLQYFCGFSCFQPNGLTISPELLASFDALDDQLLEEITHFCSLHIQKNDRKK